MNSDQWSIRLFGTHSWMALDQATVLCDPLTTHFVGLGYFPKLLRPTGIIMQRIIIDVEHFYDQKLSKLQLC